MDTCLAATSACLASHSWAHIPLCSSRQRHPKDFVSYPLLRFLLNAERRLRTLGRWPASARHTRAALSWSCILPRPSPGCWGHPPLKRLGLVLDLACTLKHPLLGLLHVPLALLSLTTRTPKRDTPDHQRQRQDHPLADVDSTCNGRRTLLVDANTLAAFRSASDRHLVARSSILVRNAPLVAPSWATQIRSIFLLCLNRKSKITRLRLTPIRELS